MKAFNEADFILVCASPGGPAGDEPHKLNTYLHLDRIAVRQLQYRLVLPQPRCPAVSVQLPGCSWDSIPEEAKSLSRYESVQIILSQVYSNLSNFYLTEVLFICCSILLIKHVLTEAGNSCINSF